MSYGSQIDRYGYSQVHTASPEGVTSYTTITGPDHEEQAARSVVYWKHFGHTDIRVERSDGSVTKH